VCLGAAGVCVCGVQVCYINVLRVGIYPEWPGKGRCRDIQGITLVLGREVSSIPRGRTLTLVTQCLETPQYAAYIVQCLVLKLRRVQQYHSRQSMT
jgi:hypothetical protein